MGCVVLNMSPIQNVQTINNLWIPTIPTSQDWNLCSDKTQEKKNGKISLLFSSKLIIYTLVMSSSTPK